MENFSIYNWNLHNVRINNIIIIDRSKRKTKKSLTNHSNSNIKKMCIVLKTSFFLFLRSRGKMNQL